MPLVKYIIEKTDRLHTEQREWLNKQATGGNIFPFIYACNAYIEERIGDELAQIELKHVAEQKPFFVRGLAANLITSLKQSLLPTITHEFNILKENGFLSETEGFDYFIAHYTNSTDWIDYFFDKYEALAPVLQRSIHLFAASCAEFISRLDQDLVQLIATFNIETPKVTALNAFAGDMHNGWKSTIEVSFHNQKVYYKPRLLKNEEKVYAFYHFLEEHGLRRSIRSLQVISFDDDDYGWMEGVSCRSVTSLAGLKEFYINQGVNLCIAYFLGMTDLIGDNILADGELPVYYDLECILQPTIKENLDKHLYESASTSAAVIATSVLRTSLLPEYGFGTETHPGISTAGLSFIDEEKILPQLVIDFSGGTFKRDFKRLPFDTSNASIPSLEDGTRYHSSAFIRELLQGFSTGYDFVSLHKEKITHFLERNFKHIKTRVLYRPSYVYARLLGESFHPKYLVSRKKIDTLFESLKNGQSDLKRNKKVIDSEIEQIGKMEIPIFYTYADALSLRAQQTEVASDFFDLTGMAEARNRIESASSRDKELQMELIVNSFVIHESLVPENVFVEAPRLTGGSRGFGNTADSNDSAMVSQLLQAGAVEIGERILSKAFTEDSIPSFLGITQSANYTWVQTNKKFGIFDGVDGFAFFYLCLYKSTQDRKYLQLATLLVEKGIAQFAAYEPYYKTLSGFNKISLFNYPLSSFYMAELFLREGLEVKGVNESTLDLVYRWIEDAISQDRDYDLLSGCAGAIVYVCKLYERTREEKYLQLGLKAARHISGNATVYKDSLCWPTIHNKAFTGFSHGTSGIAYALFMLNSYVDSHSLARSGIQALQFERTLFNAEKKNWAYFMLTDRHHIDFFENHFWAYGSGGIGLSRVLISKYYQEEAFMEEIATARENMLKHGPVGNHNFSSGLFGNLYNLYKISDFLGDKDMLSGLQRYTYTLLKEKQPNQKWKCAPIGQNYSFVEMDGLFSGIAGIGYTMLQLANKDSLPDIL